MLKYFEDLVGKDLEWFVLGQLLFDFAVFLTPIALPLAVLLSSLMTFGNLGEHFELTAIKSAGISLLRALQPIFIFSLLLTVFAFFSNNYFVPKAALNAYSLLWDIKEKKPALDLKAGAFYNGIEGFSIKTNYKGTDQQLYGVTIYDHREGDGNKKVTLADSGRMFTFNDGRYLAIELYNGRSYMEGVASEQSKTRRSSNKPESLSRVKFSRTKYVFDLSSFDIGQTDPNLFARNRIMRNLFELNGDIDSLNEIQKETRYKTLRGIQSYYTYELKEEVDLDDQYKPFQQKLDSISKPKIPEDVQLKEQLRRVESEKQEGKLEDVIEKRIQLKNEMEANFENDPSFSIAKLDSFFNAPNQKRRVVDAALTSARQNKNKLESQNTMLKNYIDNNRMYTFQWHKILADSLACFVMFLIGAPLGAIIKKGGLGMPVLLSIVFFILYYILTMTGKKWGEYGVVDEFIGAWMADAILLVIGLFFLRQARVDARLFDSDFYAVVFSKLKALWRKKAQNTN